jgi:2-dehydropantoate 2-reductase
MKIAVLGAGATGSILAAHLKNSGEEVILIARGQRASLLQEKGITVKGLSEFNVSCPVATDPTDVKDADLLMVTVKTYDMDEALAGLKHMKISAAISVQNGVIKNDQLTAVFGEDKTLGGAFFSSGEVDADGSVRFTLNQCFYVGEPTGGISRRVEDIVSVLEKAGIKAKASAAIQTIEWSKFISWLGMMSLAVLTRMETHKFLSHPDTARICARIMKEAAMAAENLGIELEDRPPFPIRSILHQTEDLTVKTLCGIGEFMKAATPGHRVSGLQDLERGRRLEAGETLGYIINKAELSGIPVPTIETAYRLISGINDYLGNG